MADLQFSVPSALIHAGTERRLGAPATAPIVPTSIFVSWGEPDLNRSYARSANPTWEVLEAIGDQIVLGGPNPAPAP